MADSGAGWTASQSHNDVSLGLVGIPSMQESAQTAAEFDFDFDLDVGTGNELDAHIDTLYANSGIVNGQQLNQYGITTGLTSVNPNFDPSLQFQGYIPSEPYAHTNEAAQYNPFAVQDNFQYPEPQGYYRPQETPYFNSNSDPFAFSENFFGTPGLAALPGNNAYGIDQTPPQPYMYPNGLWALPAGLETLPPQDTGYSSGDIVSHNDATVQFPPNPYEQLAITEPQGFATAPVPMSNSTSILNHTRDVVKQRKYQEPESESESDYDSDSEYQDCETTITKASRQANRRQARRDSVSSEGTPTTTPAEPTKYVPGEKPKKVDAKPWIRTNANTEGDTRTAKINNWKNKYEYKPLPLGNWDSGKHTFKYTQYENVDFLTEAPMSIRKIKEYIMNYPSDATKRLILWIQKMPADQGRRYGSKQHSKCVFKDCPIQRYVEGTISTGEYRVAFDEKHYTYSGEVDPYDCAAYAHLYCMEQFLDFEQVCQAADVRIDTRLDMLLEPNGKAAFSMVDVPARLEMERFVKAASIGKLRHTQRWHKYPVHSEYQRDQQKPHEYTLTHLAHRMYEAHQDDSHKRQAALRRITVSQRRVHLGDLEMSVADKRIMIEVFGGKKKGRKGKVEDYYDERIRYQIARAQRDAEDFLAQKRHSKAPGKKTHKRKAIHLDVKDMDNEPFTPEHHTPSPRPTRAKRNRINYAESPVQTHTEHIPAPASELPLNLQTHTSPPPTLPLNPSSSTFSTPYGLYAIPDTPCHDISNFPYSSNVPTHSLEALMALERRQSLAHASPLPAVESPGVRGSHAQGRRRAGFNAWPVTGRKVFRVGDPPRAVGGEAEAEAEGARRSERLAGRRG